MIDVARRTLKRADRSAANAPGSVVGGIPFREAFAGNNRGVGDDYRSRCTRSDSTGFCRIWYRNDAFLLALREAFHGESRFDVRRPDVAIERCHAFGLMPVSRLNQRPRWD